MQLLSPLGLFFFVSLSWQIPLGKEPKSQILDALSIPLTDWEDKAFCSSSWARYNVIYGALLWRGGLIDSLAFIFQKSHNVSPNSQAKKLISGLFNENNGMDTMINEDYPKKNLGCVAGHLYAFKCMGTGDYSLFSESIARTCGRVFEERTLIGLLDREAFVTENGFWIEDFAASLISSFVYLSAKHCKSVAGSRAVLNNYRQEFHSALKSIQFAFPQLTRGKLSFPSESILKRSDFGDDDDENSRRFGQLVKLLNEDFMELRIATELEFEFDVTAPNGQSWANCVETTISNWILAGCYNALDDSFDLSRMLSASAVDEKGLNAFVEGANGFDGNVNARGFNLKYQNLPFVIYSNIVLPDKQVLKSGDEMWSGVVLVTPEYLKERKLPKVPFHGMQCYSMMDFRSKIRLLVIELETVGKGCWLYEVNSFPINILTVGHHLGVESILDVFKTAEEAFKLCCIDSLPLLNAINEEGALGRCKATAISCGMILDFPFGRALVFQEHSVFKGKRSNDIDLYCYPLLQEDYLLRQIYHMENVFCPIERTISGFVNCKNSNWLDSGYSMSLSLLSYVEKMNHHNVHAALKQTIVSNLDMWLQKSKSKKEHFLLVSSIALLVEDYASGGGSDHGAFSMIWNELENLAERQAFLRPLLSFLACSVENFRGDLFASLVQKYCSGASPLTVYKELLWNLSANALLTISQDVIFSANVTLEEKTSYLVDLSLQYYKKSETIKSIWQSIQLFPHLSQCYFHELKQKCLENNEKVVLLTVAYALQHTGELAFIGELSFSGSIKESGFEAYFESDYLEKITMLKTKYGHTNLLTALEPFCLDSF